MTEPMSKSAIKLLIEEIPKSECAACIYAHYDESAKNWTCRAHPPTVAPLLERMRDGQTRMNGTISVFPSALARCGEWHPKLAIMAPEKVS
jgi:hypothetical protein